MIWLCCVNERCSRELSVNFVFCSRMSYNEFSQKYSRDERFRSVERTRDRETYFQEYIAELKKKEKENRKVEKEKVCLNSTDSMPPSTVYNSFFDTGKRKISACSQRWYN